MNMNLTERLKKATEIDRANYLVSAAKKQGYLRAGNSGIMSAEGDIAGGCHRVAHLRALGIELDPPDASRLLMFAGGFASEQRIYEELLSSLLPGEIILREDEIPIEWKTSNGTTVSGRPDIVICDAPVVMESLDVLNPDSEVQEIEIQKAKPKFVIEAKSVNSVWVSRDVYFSGKPKLEQVIQASHYAWKLGIPAKLMSRQCNQQVVPAFGLFLPKPGEPLSESVEYNEKGKPKHVKPFEVIYDLDIDAKGWVRYRKEGTEEWNKTLVNTGDIERYFEFVSKMGQDKTLGPELMLLDVDGKQKNYKHSAYCEACRIAENVGNNYEDWLGLCKEESEKAVGIPMIPPMKD
jgi:hypothetical protein